MKSYSDKVLLLTAGVLLSLVSQGPAAQSAKALAPVPGPAAPAHVEIPQSVFNVPSSPKEGRNPFFPRSTTAAPVINPKTPVDNSSIVLNGITSPPKRTAMINGRTFEAGEEGEIRTLNGGRLLIKCIEIKNESAIIDISGQRRELRLRLGI